MSIRKEIQIYAKPTDDPVPDRYKDCFWVWPDSKYNAYKMLTVFCGAYCQNLILGCTNLAVMLSYEEGRTNDGQCFIGQEPEDATRIQYSLAYPLQLFKKLEGPLWKAGRMEDKWDMYAFNDVFYFCSSWLNTLAIKAGFERNEENNTLQVTWIEFSPSHYQVVPQIVDRQVDTLIKVLLGIRPPVPVPSRKLQTVLEYTNYASGIYGAIPFFATNEDTTTIRILESGAMSLDGKTPLEIPDKLDKFFVGKINRK